MKPKPKTTKQSSKARKPIVFELNERIDQHFADSFVEAWSNRDASRPVLFVIENSGGLAKHGLMIADAIERCKTPTTAIIKDASSVAATIALACDEVFMHGEDSRLMIHGVRKVGGEPSDSDQSEIAELNARSGWHIEQGSSLNSHQVMTMLCDGQDHEFSAEQCVKLGFAKGFQEAPELPTTSKRKSNVTRDLINGPGGVKYRYTVHSLQRRSAFTTTSQTEAMEFWMRNGGQIERAGSDGSSEAFSPLRSEKDLREAGITPGNAMPTACASRNDLIDARMMELIS